MTTCKSSDLKELCSVLERKGVQIDEKLLHQLDKLNIHAIDALKRLK